MNILLDTHVLLWVSEDNKNIPANTRKEILDGRNAIFYSTASIWELAIKKNLGKIIINLEDFIIFLEDMRILELPIYNKHILKLEDLASVHKDPFDRIMVAQALSEPMKLYTHDELLLKYSSDLIRLI